MTKKEWIEGLKRAMSPEDLAMVKVMRREYLIKCWISVFINLTAYTSIIIVVAASIKYLLF